MKKKRIVFDFGSTYFTVFSEGRILLRKPVAIVMKKSLQRQVVSTGYDALASKDAIGEDEFFHIPVKKGIVAHRDGCIGLIKEYLTEVFGRFNCPPLCVLVGCGLNSEQRLEIERVFVDAGYADIVLMESLLGLMPAADKKGISAGILIGGETTEFGLFFEGKLISGYSLDIGSATVNERIKNYVRDNYKLTISDEGAEELKIKAASLYPDDDTRVTIGGIDALTGRAKKFAVNAKELHSEVAYVFGRVMKVMDAALMSAPMEIVQKVGDTGIIIAGYGSFQEGLRDYATKYFNVPVYVAPIEDRLPFSGAEELSNDDFYLSVYLSLNKQVKKKH